MASSHDTPDLICTILDKANLPAYQDAAEAWVASTGCKISHLEEEPYVREFAEALGLRKFPTEDFVKAVASVVWDLGGHPAPG